MKDLLNCVYTDEFWWNPMDTAPKNGMHIIIRDEDNKIHEHAHWACDTSGEDQPSFKGWFTPIKSSINRVMYNAEILNPKEWRYVYNPRIVCAANKLKDGNIVIGIRHHDVFMNKQIRLMESSMVDEIEGFVDQYGNFYDRKKALKIAKRNKQIIRTEGIPDSCLYSENLY
jgi:hypothetical protein